jgi:hypothetical protein
MDISELEIFRMIIVEGEDENQWSCRSVHITALCCSDLSILLLIPTVYSNVL